MAKKKRSNGEGSLTYRKDRDRYEARLTTGRDAAGRPTRRTVTGKTRQIALERLGELKRQQSAGVTIGANATLEQFLNSWLTDVLPLGDTTAGTRASYESNVRLHIVPVIGHVRLDKLTTAHVRQVLSKMQTNGSAPNSQRIARAVLRRALDTAVRDELVMRNVAAATDGVRLTKKEGRTPTPEQARTLLSTASNTEWDVPVALMLSLGLRRGEALGLAWSDLDLDGERPALTVRHSLKPDERGALHLGNAKTSGSRRTLHLPAAMVEKLRAQRARQASEQLAFGPGWGGKWQKIGLVLTNSVGSPYDPGRLLRAVKKLTGDLGFGEWTPHELRHSAASLMLAGNVPLKTVSDTLGHASIRLTADVYGHLMAPARDDAADAMSRLLWPAVGGD